MASQGIWLMSFLVYGLLLEVLKGGLVGYRLITSLEHMYQAQQEQHTTTEPHFGFLDRVSTTDAPENLNPISTSKGLVINKPTAGQEGYIGTSIKECKRHTVGMTYYLNSNSSCQKARYSTSNWNQNQHKHRTTPEPRLRAFDRVNTSGAPEEFEPVTNSKGVVISKPVHVQEIFNDVFNPENVTDGGRVSKKHMPFNQPQKWTTTESQLGVFDRINTTHIFKKSEPAANNRPQNRTATEPQLVVFDRINTTDVSEEFEPVTNNQSQNRTTTEPHLWIFDRINKTHVSEEFEPVKNNQSQNGTITNTQSRVFDNVNTTDVSEEFQPVKNNQSQNGTITNTQSGVFDNVNTTDVSEEFEPVTITQPQNRTTTKSRLWIFDRINTTDVSEEFERVKNNQPQNRTITKTKSGVIDTINTTDVSEEFEPAKNNQPQNRTTTELELGVFDRTNATDVSEEFEPVTSNQSQNRTTTEPQLGISDRINTTDVSEELEPAANNQPPNRTATEPQSEGFDKINTTDVSEEFQPVTDYKGVAINKPLHGQEMYNDITSQGHTTINRNKASDTVLSQNQTQNRTTTEPRRGEYDRVNTTDVSQGSEPETNSTGVVINQPVPGREMSNATLKSGNRNMSRLIKQGVTKLQAAESRVKQTNGTVRIVNTLITKGNDSKGQVQLYSAIRKKQRNELAKTRSSRKQGEHKGHAVNNPDNISRNSLPKTRPQHRTTTETRLGAFDRVNTTDVPEKFQPVTNSTGVVINQPLPGQDTHKDTLISGNVNASRLIKQRVTKLQAAESGAKQTNGTVSIINTLTTKGKDSKGQVQLHSVIRKKQGKEHTKARNSRKQGHAVINSNKISRNSLPKTRLQHRTTTETRLGAFDRVNTTDVPEKFEPVTNSTGVVINQPVPGQQMHKDTLISGHTINIRDKGSDTSLSQNQTQNRTTEPRLVAFDRVNTTDVPEKFQPVTNSTVVVINQPAPGQEMRKDTLISGHTIINGAKVSDTALSQNHTQNSTTTEPRLGTFDRINTTDVAEEFESLTNSTGAVINQPVPGREMHNATLKSGNVNTSRLIKQRVTKLKRAESGAKQVNGTVRIVNTLTTKGKDSNGQVQLHSVIRKKQGNEHTKARNRRKQGKHKEHTISNRDKVRDTSLSQNQTQNRTTTEPRLGAFDRVNTTDVPEKFELESNSTGVVINQVVPGQQMGKDTLISGHTISNRDKVSDTSLPQNQTQNRTTTEPRLGVFDRVNTTDVAEEFEPVTNSTGVVINQLVPGQQMWKDSLISGHTISNSDKVSDTSLSQDQTQNRTTTEPRLGVFDRVNTTDVAEEFEPVTNSTGVVINQLVPGQQMWKDSLISGHTISNRDKVSDTSLSQNQTQNRTTTEPRLGVFDRVNTTDVAEEFEPVTNSTGVVINQLVPGQQTWKDSLISGHTISNSDKVSDTSLSQNQTQNRTTTEPRLGVFDRVNTTDVAEEFEPVTNSTGVVINQLVPGQQTRKDSLISGHTISNRDKVSDTSLSQDQTQNRTTTEPRLGVFDRVNTTDVAEEFEPVTNSTGVVINQLVPGQQMWKDSLILGHTISNSDKVSDTSLSQNQTQNRTTTEPRLGVFDRVNTTDVAEEFEPVTNSTGEVINQLVPGQQMWKDSLISGHTISNRDKVSDTSLPQNQTQNRTITEPRLMAFDRVNTTDIAEEFEPITNSSVVFINQPVPGREMHNATLKSGNGNMTTLIKQAVIKLQAAESGAKQANGTVKIANTLTTKGKDSKGQVQLHSVISKKQGTKVRKARNRRKQGEHKGTDKERGKK